MCSFPCSQKWSSVFFFPIGRLTFSICISWDNNYFVPIGQSQDALWKWNDKITKSYVNTEHAQLSLISDRYMAKVSTFDQPKVNEKMVNFVPSIQKWFFNENCNSCKIFLSFHISIPVSFNGYSITALFNQFRCLHTAYSEPNRWNEGGKVLSEMSQLENLFSHDKDI